MGVLLATATKPTRVSTIPYGPEMSARILQSSCMLLSCIWARYECPDYEYECTFITEQLHVAQFKMLLKLRWARDECPDYEYGPDMSARIINVLDIGQI
jgi:hypothetical protein